MKHNKKNKPANQLNCDKPRHTAQDDLFTGEKQTNKFMPDEETDEYEIIEVRDRDSYESLSQKDRRATTLNIKIRNG